MFQNIHFFFHFVNVAEVMIIYKKPNLAINESKYFKTSFYIVGSLTWNLIYKTTNFFKKICN
jgi:hypothetical protein